MAMNIIITNKNKWGPVFSLSHSKNTNNSKGAVIRNPMGTGAEDFWHGYETFSIIFWGLQNFKSILVGYKTILLEKILDEVIKQRLKEKLRSIWK